jgi:hypothetical protein
MRYVTLLVAALFIGACGDDDTSDPHGGAGKGGSHSHAGEGGSHSHAGTGGKPGAPADAGVDAGDSTSKLDRPGSLPRPPKDGLPSELRPPR